MRMPEFYHYNEDELNKIVADVIKNNPNPVEEYKKGKTGVLGFLVGQVMKLSGGKADPKTVSTLLLEKL